MADEALRARGSDIWIWALVALATASVVALAVVQRNRAGDERFPARVGSAVELPLLGGGKGALPLGKVTLVDFWATWCAPCRVSMPRVQKLWAEYKPRGMELYSVDTDDPSPGREAEIQAFLKENGVNVMAEIFRAPQFDLAFQRLPGVRVAFGTMTRKDQCYFRRWWC